MDPDSFQGVTVMITALPANKQQTQCQVMCNVI